MPRSVLVLAALLAPAARAGAGAGEPVASPEAMAASREDLWGEAAIRQPGGPSYEFYKDLLPPLRYVNTTFRHYPVMLGAPGGAVKGRWVSDGSAVNARAEKPPMWKEFGIPVRFLVGEGKDWEPFGADPDRLDGPRFPTPGVPRVRVGYRAGRSAYVQDAFASVRDPLAACGTVLVSFTGDGAPGSVTARFDSPPPLREDKGRLLDEQGRVVALFGDGWAFEPGSNTLRCRLAAGRRAVLGVVTKPTELPDAALDGPRFDEEAAASATAWRDLIGKGARFDIPEDLVNRVWPALVADNFAISVGDRMHYSSGNAYDHLYEGECGDAVRSLLLFGHADAARRMVGPLLDFNRQDTRFHVAGHKLQLLSHYYWVTRDAGYMKEKQAVWEKVIAFVRSNRSAENGLLPPDRYAGDIARKVVSLNSNANCWRGLRDMAAVADDLGRGDLAAELRAEAGAFRKAILDAVARSERKDVDPPFIPIALLAGEEPHDPLTATRTGSYYDLIAPYILGSEVFGPGDDRENWMIDYLRRHGGLAMGMIRSTPHQGQFNGMPGVNVLYGLRYNLTVLRRDDRDHALAGFYGHLAQGMTRDTFVGGEGSRFFHGDRRGRSFYLPPNAASNAAFLTTLRYLLIQDWDLNDDGRPETLRLLYGAPGRWLADGKALRVERAPSAFGPLRFSAESHLSDGDVSVRVEPPPRRPDRLLLRPPLPPGWAVESATVGGEAVSVASDGSVDLTGREGPSIVRFRVRRAGS